MSSLKVLLVLMGMEIGGAETHVLELAIGLKKQGVDVLVASNGGVYTAELEENGIRHFSLPLHNKKVKNMVKSFWGLKKIIQQEKPDVVHGHARIPSFLLAQLNRFIKFNFMTTAHWVFDTSGVLGYLTNWGYRTIAVSNDIKQYLIDNYGILPQDITVTINGISMDKFSPAHSCGEILEEFGMKKDTRKIVYISRMDEDRSLVAHHLIQVAPALRKKEPVEIVIVGGGNDFDAVKQEAEAANKEAGERYIYITGARTDIYKFVSIADFVVAVSRSALEAMSAAVPVIVAGNEGYIGIFGEDKLHDAIKTNFCCRGMDESTPSLLKRDLLAMLDYDKECLKEIGNYGRELIAANYSVDRMVADNLKVYRELTAHGNQYKDAVISGYYGYKNSGDDALLYAIINEVRERKPNARFLVLSSNPKETKATYGVDAVQRFNFFKISKALRHTKLLISGGGSLMQDGTSTHSLVYYIIIKRLALRHGVKVMMYANGIGPLLKNKNRKRVRNILKKMDYITLRDQQSYHLLKKMDVKLNHVEVTADPALGIKPAAPETALEILRKEGVPQGEYVGISVRDWDACRGIENEIAKAADYLVQERGLIPVFIPMHIPDDLRISERCVRLMKEKGYVLKNRYGFREVMALAGQCKFVVGMRLHLLMYATAMAKPVVGLVYDPKVEGYLSYLNQDCTVSVNGMTARELIEKIDGVLVNYDEICEKMKLVVVELQKKTTRNAEVAQRLLEEN